MRFPRAPMQYFYSFQRRRLWCQLAMTSSGRDALMGAGIFPWAVDSSDFLTGPFQLLESETAFKGQKREEKKIQYYPKDRCLLQNHEFPAFTRLDPNSSFSPLCQLFSQGGCLMALLCSDPAGFGVYSCCTLARQESFVEIAAIKGMKS